MSLKTNVLILIATTMLTVTAFAQGAPETGAVFATGSAALPAPHPGAGVMSMHMGIHVDDMDAAPVKGAPFCATITTEHTQPFADGNRIHTTDTSTMCRDSEGRTRRESGLNLLGAAPQKSTPKLITIIDPVAGVHYMLNTETKVAHKMVVPRSAGAATANGHEALAVPHKEQRVMVHQGAGSAGPSLNVFYMNSGPGSDEPAPTTESLGDQTIEGIHATGTRLTTTIPTGQMGNDQPILVTSERWYSPELKATVMTKHNDPWAGELKTEFSSVNTSEPAASLFSVPADYKIMEDKDGPFVMQLPSSLPPRPAPPQ